MPDSEGASILAELTPPYTLRMPAEQLTPVVFCSPHSGSIYPRAFLEASRLDPHTLRSQFKPYTDAFGIELEWPPGARAARSARN